MCAIKKPTSFFTDEKKEPPFLSDNYINEMAKTFLKENIGLSDAMKVSELEKLLEEQLGLLGQILHKSGNRWLKISHTSQRTLKEQNELGKELAKK